MLKIQKLGVWPSNKSKFSHLWHPNHIMSFQFSAANVRQYQHHWLPSNSRHFRNSDITFYVLSWTSFTKMRVLWSFLLDIKQINNISSLPCYSSLRIKFFFILNFFFYFFFVFLTSCISIPFISPSLCICPMTLQPYLTKIK